jgi:3'-phosphoadenosine 5'-phosphosulfate sulfotransferase (PAPS reductase)/FAD synthetase
MKIKRIVSWYSCGVTSAVATKLILEKYGAGDVPIVIAYCDTGSEHDDNIRFIRECEKWFGQSIQILKNIEYVNTFSVYEKFNFIANRFGARCSLELKKKVRQQFEDLSGDLQIFGFDYNEKNRAKRFNENNPEVTTEFPLIDAKLTKADCIKQLQDLNIELPIAYKLGFKNNNCLKTGCVKGAAGYWNFYRKYNPEGFDKMAKFSRRIGCKLVMRKGEHIFLDELDPSWGNYKSELPIECGLFCGIL